MNINGEQQIAGYPAMQVRDTIKKMAEMFTDKDIVDDGYSQRGAKQIARELLCDGFSRDQTAAHTREIYDPHR